MFIVKVSIEGVQKYAGSAKTASEAQAILGEANRRQQEGAPLKDYEGTVGAWLNEWLTTYKAGKCQQTSYAWYERIIRVHLIPAFGTVKLTALTDGMVQRWVNKLEKAKSSATVHHAYKVLHMAVSFAALKDKVRRDMTDPKLIKLPPEDKKEVKMMDEKEQARFFEAADHTPWSLYFRLTSNTAARRGETLGLKWPDLDEDKKLLHIERSLARVFYAKGDTRLELKDCKTDRSNRTLPLSGDLVLRLKNHRLTQKELRLKSAAVWRETLAANPEYEGLIFTTDSGKPIEPRNIERAFAAICKKAKLKGFTLHGLRHTTATEMLDAGVDLKVISEFLGHSNVAITDRIYVKVRPEKLEEAANQLAAHKARLTGKKVA